MNAPTDPTASEATLPESTPIIAAEAKTEEATATLIKPEAISDSKADDKSEHTHKSAGVYTKGLRACGNCGTELLGETCYQCGQPTKGLVRQFSSILGDFFDTVLNIDTRLFRTLGPLIYRPGFLTQEYFSGRRIRYVSPVRLFFFLAVLTFLLAQFSLPDDMGSDENGSGIINIDSGDDISKIKTLEEAEKLRAEALKGLDEAKSDVGGVPMAAAGLEKAKSEVNRKIDKRIAELKKQYAITTSTAILTSSDTNAKAAEEEDQGGNISFNGEVWDAKENPIKVQWLPASINRWFNSLAQRAENNGKRINKDPKVIIEALLSSLPMTLFLMLPVFALLLKIMFIFKRRLYMEHLIVALHSHAFLMLAILLLLLFNDVSAWLSAYSLVTLPLGILTVVLWIWMPIYLFLMQKRVYQQGWILTFIKYAIIGNCYILLLSIAISFALITKMIWL